MTGPNYPGNVSQRDITNLCKPNDFIPNTEECFLCGLQIEQDDDSRGWFPADLYYKPRLSDFLDSFETQQGWCCSTACWNDRVALNADEVPHASDCNVWVKEPCSCVTGGGIHLVKGRTA